MRIALLVAFAMCAFGFTSAAGRAQSLPPFIVPPGLPIPKDTPVYRLPPMSISDLKMALQSSPIVFTPTPQNQMPSYDPIAHYVPQGEDPQNPIAHILVGSSYSGLLDPAQTATSDARKALLSAAILDVMDSGSAGPGYKILYALDTDLDQHCTCPDRYSSRHKDAAGLADELLAQHFVLGLPTVPK